VLCQQVLGDEEKSRFNRFKAFMEDTTERDALAAEQQLAMRRGDISKLSGTPSSVAAALAALEAGGETVVEARAWLYAADATLALVIAFADGRSAAPPAPMTADPGAGIALRAAALRDEASAIDATSFARALSAAAALVQTLRDAAFLAAAKAKLVQQRDYLKAKAQIEAARRHTDTTGITRKSTELTTQHVTTLVRDAFTRETERLGLRQVTLDPTQGRRGVTLEHKPKLLGATVSADIDDVLSEGEQTALGLAGFLTEVTFDVTKSGVVFDDPVTSLDAGRRSRVAKRLTELAQERQVIVFTHEVTFVNALNQQARDIGVDVTALAIMREGQTPGKVLNEHPWSAKDPDKRITALREELDQIKRDRGQLDSVEYCDRAQLWAGHLSQAWERAVNLGIAGQLVDRGTNEVKPRMFKMLPLITDADNTDFQAGYSAASGWAPRHDQAPDVNFVPPEPDDMEAELARITDWYTRIRSYRK
jgi:hypothetical protein